ncbi:efflux transporter outer membrane subunit [Taibaiella koreensis]|uniref:efflux transporter outer membrane subunit n=1 Tax=Taibaiella koreensis TaxID=1268548 RepID=UPI000E59A879|nr:efflux transporter outer membrane subunit [Taibaiella koreensis]
MFTGTTYRYLYMVALLVLLLQACRIARPYQRPAEIVSDSLYRDTRTGDTVSIGAVPWRQLFSGKLRLLVDEGLQHNLDLQVAVARMKQADAVLAQSRQAFFPSLSANASTTQQHLSDAQAGRTEVYQLYAASAWELDIWGKLRSTKRAALAAFLQSDAYRRAVQTQLIADIASDYYALMAYDAQLSLTLKTVENRKQDVETMKTLKESDVVTGAAVVQSEANRYSVEVTLPDIRQNIRQTENALCLLLGRSPGSISRDSLSGEVVATDLRTGVPAQLLANRPDVQEAEYQLRNSAELVNVARTYFYPTLSITAQAGLYNNSLSGFFDPGSFFANIIGGLAQPIFNNGLNKQRLHIAQAQQEEYLADFKKAVLNAGQEVSNALYQYQAAADKMSIRAHQIENLRKSVEYTKELLKYTSNTNYTDVLTSEQSLLAAELNSINDRLQQLQAVVALYRSLGGGWR